MRKLTIVVVVVLVFGLVSNGLAAVVAQWSFEDNMLDTASGGVVADDLTPAGAPTYVPGIIGKAMDFTSADSGSAADSADIDLPVNYTIEAFIKPASIAGWLHVAQRWGVAGDRLFHFGIDGHSAGPRLWYNHAESDGGVASVYNGHNSVEVGEWYHIAVTSNSATGLKLYLDGALVASAGHDGTIDSTDNPLRVGGGYQGFVGVIDELLMHDETKDLAYMQSRAALLTEPSPPNLVATNPVPGDGATQVEPNVVLSWDAPADVANPSYRVYLSTEADFSGITGIFVTQTYLPKGYLQSEKEYYWRVDVIDPAGPAYIGSTWSFTTFKVTCEPPLLGDLTGDCVVDLRDFYELSENWLKCNLVPSMPEGYLWPTYRHDSQLTAFSPLRGGLASSPQVAWSVALNDGITTKTEQWFVHDFNGDNNYELLRVQKTGLVCQNLATGNIEWEIAGLSDPAVLDIRDYTGDGTKGIFLKNVILSNGKEDFYMVSGVNGHSTLLSSADGFFGYGYRFGELLPEVAGQEILVYWDKNATGTASTVGHASIWSFEQGTDNPTSRFEIVNAAPDIYGSQYFFADMDNDGQTEIVQLSAEHIWSFDLQTSQLEAYLSWSPNIRSYWAIVGAEQLSPGAYPSLLMINNHIPGVQVITQNGSSATRLWKQVIGPVESQYQLDIVVRSGAPDPFMDIDNDGVLEIMTFVSNEHDDKLKYLVIFNANTGARLFDQPGIDILSVDDLDGDSIPEIMLTENGIFKITHWNGGQFVSLWQSASAEPLLKPAPIERSINRTAGIEGTVPYNPPLWREIAGQLPFLLSINGSVWACTLDASGQTINMLRSITVHEAIGNVPNPNPQPDSYTWQGDNLLYYMEGVYVASYQIPEQVDYMPPPAIVGKLGKEIRVIGRDNTGNLLSFSSAGTDQQHLISGNPADPYIWVYHRSDTSICDVDGDGQNEILTTTSQGGKSVVILDWQGQIERRIEPVANFTEVALGPSGSMGPGLGRWFVVRYARSLDNEIVIAYNGSTGAELWSRDWYNTETERFVLHIPTAVYDCDQDGAEDLLVAAGGYYGIISVVDNRDLLASTVLSGKIPGAWLVYSTPMLCDLDSQGAPEVFYSRAVGAAFVSDIWGNPIWGSILTPTYAVPRTHPGFADLDGDGVKDIVIAQPDGLLRAFAGTTGQQRWTYQLQGPMMGLPNGDSKQDFASADLDNDGHVELLIGSSDGRLYALKEVNGACTVLWSVDLGYPVGSPIIVDLDYDAKPEILVPTQNGMLHCLKL